MRDRDGAVTAPTRATRADSGPGWGGQGLPDRLGAYPDEPPEHWWEHCSEQVPEPGEAGWGQSAERRIRTLRPSHPFARARNRVPGTRPRRAWAAGTGALLLLGAAAGLARLVDGPADPEGTTSTVLAGGRTPGIGAGTGQDGATAGRSGSGASLVSLTDALTTSRVELPLAATVLEAGPGGIARWRRVDTAVADDGTVQVAWQGADGVHVTPLTAGLVRAGADVVVAGAREVGGLVARADGFALLTRLPRGTSGPTDAHLVGYGSGRLLFDTALTGPASRDSSPVLDGRLAWNGSRYGASFAVRSATGPQDARDSDKLVYVDAGGRRLPGGWERGCGRSLGTALVAEKPGAFASLCVEDRRSGIFVTTGTGSTAHAPLVSPEDCRDGACGAELGDLVKTPSGRYAVAYGTRGAVTAPRAGTGGSRIDGRTPTHQVAVAFLRDRSTPDGSPVLLTHDPGTDHVNVRLAPYGTGRLLLSYETVSGARCASGVCTGTFTGTHVLLIDLSGRPLTPDVVVPVHVAGAIGVLPGGDLVWTAADTSPDRREPLGPGDGPTTRTLSVTRLSVVAG